MKKSGHAGGLIIYDHEKITRETFLKKLREEHNPA